MRDYKTWDRRRRELHPDSIHEENYSYCPWLGALTATFHPNGNSWVRWEVYI